jgi:predicted dehydrogenase
MTAATRTDKRSHPSSAPVGIGVVGCGYWGPNLIRNFFETPGCRVERICDASPDRLAAMQRRYPSVRLSLQFEELLTDPAVDAVVIATPVHTHGPLVKRALEAGKHVLVEKPMTLSVEESEELVALAARLDRTLMVDHTFVYTGAIRRIKELLDTGELGRLYYYDSVRVNLGIVQHDVSVVRDLAAHDFAIMDYLLPQRPVGVSAMGAAHLPGGLTDVAYLTVQFEDNLLAHFHVNWLSPVKIRQVLVGGDRRMVVYDDIQPTEKVKVYDRGITWTDDPTEARREALVAYRSGDVHIPKLDQTEALRNECAHFIECVRTGATPITDGAAGLRTVRLLDAAERSLAAAGAMVTISPTRAS